MYRNLCGNTAELLVPKVSKLPKEFRKGFYARLPYANQENLFHAIIYAFGRQKWLKNLFTIALLGIYPREIKNICSETFMWIFTAALFIIAKRWKRPKGLSVGEWINISGVWNTIQQLKKNELLVYVIICMYLRNIMIIEGSQMQKIIYIRWFH